MNGWICFWNWTGSQCNGTELIIINEPAIRLLSVTAQYQPGQLDPSAKWDQIDLLTQHQRWCIVTMCKTYYIANAQCIIVYVVVRVLGCNISHHCVWVCPIEMIWDALRERKYDMVRTDCSSNARRGEKTWHLNATNEPINSYNVCRMIVKSRYGVNSLR